MDDFSWVNSALCFAIPAQHPDFLGSGSGCEGVWRLVSPLTGAAYAVKLIDRHQAPQAHNASTEREVEIINRLRHPGVCRLVRVVREPDFFLLVTELCECSLFKVVAPSRLDEDHARAYCINIVAAVGYCHEQGIYHRDLKLDNVLVADTAACTVKIADFGLSKDCGSGVTVPRTNNIGTRSYMAPELTHGYDPSGYNGGAVDVWALGVMLFIMTTHSFPFGIEPHTHPNHILRAIRSGSFAFPPQVPLSEQFKHLVAGMLTVDPVARLTIAEIKAHAWVLGDADSFDALLLPGAADTTDGNAAPPHAGGAQPGAGGEGGAAVGDGAGVPLPAEEVSLWPPTSLDSDQWSLPSLGIGSSSLGISLTTPDCVGNGGGAAIMIGRPQQSRQSAAALSGGEEASLSFSISPPASLFMGSRGLDGAVPGDTDHKGFRDSGPPTLGGTVAAAAAAGGGAWAAGAGDAGGGEWALHGMEGVGPRVPS